MRVAPPPDIDALMADIDPSRLVSILRGEAPRDGNSYVHWDKLRHRTPRGT